jgi:hypothetical protein
MLRSRVAITLEALIAFYAWLVSFSLKCSVYRQVVTVWRVASPVQQIIMFFYRCKWVHIS